MESSRPVAPIYSHPASMSYHSHNMSNSSSTQGPAPYGPYPSYPHSQQHVQPMSSVPFYPVPVGHHAIPPPFPQNTHPHQPYSQHPVSTLSAPPLQRPSSPPLSSSLYKTPPSPPSSNTSSPKSTPGSSPVLSPLPPKRKHSSISGPRQNARKNLHAPDYGFAVHFPVMPVRIAVPEEQRHIMPSSESIVMKKYSTAVDSRKFLTVYEYMINNQWIIWDYHTGYVHLTGLWKAIGNNKADIVKLIENSPELEPDIKRVRGGYLKIQGTWVPFEIARALASRTCYFIRYALIPLFGEEFPDSCLKPNEPGFGQLQMRLTDPSTKRRRRKRSATTHQPLMSRYEQQQQHEHTVYHHPHPHHHQQQQQQMQYSGGHGMSNMPVGGPMPPSVPLLPTTVHSSNFASAGTGSNKPVVFSSVPINSGSHLTPSAHMLVPPPPPPVYVQTMSLSQNNTSVSGKASPVYLPSPPHFAHRLSANNTDDGEERAAKRARLNHASYALPSPFSSSQDNSNSLDQQHQQQQQLASVHAPYPHSDLSNFNSNPHHHEYHSNQTQPQLPSIRTLDNDTSGFNHNSSYTTGKPLNNNPVESSILPPISSFHTSTSSSSPTLPPLNTSPSASTVSNINQGATSEPKTPSLINGVSSEVLEATRSLQQLSAGHNSSETIGLGIAGIGSSEEHSGDTSRRWSFDAQEYKQVESNVRGNRSPRTIPVLTSPFKNLVRISQSEENSKNEGEKKRSVMDISGLLT